MKTIRLGSATGWALDRFDQAEDLVKKGNLQYICFESMSEITMSATQIKKVKKPNIPGYDPYLEERLKPIMKECTEKKIKIISNQGWLEPIAAAEKILEIAKSQGVKNIKVAAIEGGILTEKIAEMGLKFIENGELIKDYKDKIVSAEAYLGAKEIVEALKNDADVVITTRIGDACLYLGPLAYEFNWDFEDIDAIARGMIVGHLMECAGQITGGYFADPGYKDVPNIAKLGNPIAEVNENTTYITKAPDTGGVVSTETCKEQLLYEVQDPANYLCPDVIADFTKVKFVQAGNDRVKVIINGAGKPKTEFLKVLIGVKEGYMAEEMIIFAGPGAMERAKLAKSILLERFKMVNLNTQEIRMDYLGINGVHREATPLITKNPYEVILRIAIKTESFKEAKKLRREVDPMAVNGPSGTGKWAPMGDRVRPIIGLWSTLVPREEVSSSIVYRQF